MAGSGGAVRRRAVLSLCLAAITTAALPAPSTATAAPDLVARLGANDSVFWSEPEPVTGSEALEWWIEVTEPGLRLRVALDHSDLGGWTLRVNGPGAKAEATGAYSVETFIPKAKRGVYTITAHPGSVEDSVIRFRAKLEDVVEPSGKRALLPNLRITPPYDLTLRGAPWYLFLTPRVAPSCFPEETVQAAVARCLRFSFGPENAGVGPLELIYAAPAHEGGRNVMYQQITYANGRTTRRKAGTYEYHVAHAHYHHPLMAGQQLFKVTDPRKGVLEEAGDAKKTGFCMVDYTLVDWHRFYQDPAGSVTTSCSLADAPYRDLIMGLSTGWNDIYTYNLEGNYIDFDEGTNGLYVIRAYADQSGQIEETNDADNTSYAYFRVTGDEVKLLERGYGSDPWDPDKKVLNDPRNHSVPD